MRVPTNIHEGNVWNEYAGCWDNSPCGLSWEEGCPHIPECNHK